jgi:hypothetical protein
MTKIFLHITGAGQPLLLAISYTCCFTNGTATYEGKIECSTAPFTPFDPATSGTARFSFSRDALWNLAVGCICDRQGYGRAILKDVLLMVAKAIREHEMLNKKWPAIATRILNEPLSHSCIFKVKKASFPRGLLPG